MAKYHNRCKVLLDLFILYIGFGCASIADVGIGMNHALAFVTNNLIPSTAKSTYNNDKSQ